MGPIKDIPGLGQPANKVEKENNLKRVRSPKETKTGKITGTSTSPLGHNVEISETGKNLLKQEKEISRYLDNVKISVTFSPEKTQEIQRKIASSYYSKPEVLEKIVDAILTLPAFQPESIGLAQKVPDLTESNLDEQRLAEIRVKIQKGEYDSEAVLDIVVDKLLSSTQLKT